MALRHGALASNKPGRGRRYPMGDKAAAWPGMEFEQITEHGCES